MKILNAIFLTVLSSVISAHAHRVQRFIILNRSELKVVPKFEFPVQMRSLRSTFNLQIPIQLRITNHMQLRVRNQLRQFRNSNRSHFEWNHFARSVSDQARANFHDNLLESTSLNWFSGLLFKANSSMKNDAVSFKECVQKMVCQVSTIPAMHPDYGLIGDILYTLFR